MFTAQKYFYSMYELIIGGKMNTILDNKITLDRETHRYSLLDNPNIIFTSVTTY